MTIRRFMVAALIAASLAGNVRADEPQASPPRQPNMLIFGLGPSIWQDVNELDPPACALSERAGGANGGIPPIARKRAPPLAPGISP